MLFMASQTKITILRGLEFIAEKARLDSGDEILARKRFLGKLKTST